MTGNKRGNVGDMAVSAILAAHLMGAPRGANRRMAEQIGVSPATFSRWVDGSVIPQERMAAAIARAVNLEEPTVLASISFARRLRQQTQANNRMEAVRDDRYRKLEETIEALANEVREVRREIDELRGPGGARGARRRSR